jgi:hypothetical protein
MGIWMRNRAGFENDQIEYKIYHEHIANGHVAHALTGFATAPSRSTGDYMKVVLGANSDGSSPGIEFLAWSTASSRQISRRIGVWNTNPTNSNLVQAVQLNRRVTFKEDQLYDSDLQNFGTSGVFIARGLYGAYPAADVMSAVYLRVEIARVTSVDAQNRGTALIELASACTEGSATLPTFGFNTIYKGISRQNQGEVMDDEVRVVVDPGSNHYGIRVDPDCRAWIRLSGYELMPN